MANAVRLGAYEVQQLGLMRDVLDLIGHIRNIQAPMTSPEGLRQNIELVLRFAEVLGVSGEFTNRLRQMLADERRQFGPSDLGT